MIILYPLDPFKTQFIKDEYERGVSCVESAKEWDRILNESTTDYTELINDLKDIIKKVDL
jgi:hypothetical protein